MQFMDDSHYDQLIDEDVAVYRPDGSPLLVLLKKALDPQLTANAWGVIKKINTTSKNRGTASGTPSSPYKKMDGSISRQMAVPRGWEVVSNIVGSFERTAHHPFARHCAWNAKSPEKFSALFPLLQQTSSLFEKYVPDRFSNQKQFCDSTHPDWVIPGSVYTTLTINKNFRTAAHKDAGDLETGFSNMFVIREGIWTGAHLVLPNWRIGVKLDSLDFIMFDAHEFHGNTQMIKMSKKDIRCSVVCYYRTKLKICKSMEEELLFAKTRKPGDPLFPELK